MTCWSSIALSRMIKYVPVVCVIHFAAEAFQICSDRSQACNRQRFGCQRSIASSPRFMVTGEDTIWGSRLDDFSPPWDRHDKLVAEDLPLNLTASYIRRLPPNIRFKYRIRQLMEHKLKYGDYEIAAETSGLDNWIRTQRYEYRMRMQGKDSLLTPERIDLLNKIGFDWKLESQDGLTTAWLKWYEELKTHYKEHGHAQLCASDSALGKWVANQRYQYKRWKQGELPSSMTDKRRELLKDVGIVWDYRAEGQTKYDDQWQERYEQLAEFQKEHGHCFISGNSSGPLGRWISNQRWAYQNRLKYNVSTLTEKREKLLRDIGFDFDVDGFSTWQNTVWQTGYKELSEFFNKHNHTEVTPYRSPLANWVRQQRRQYRLYKEGKPCSMTQEHIEALEKLEFVWTRQNKQTEAKYNQLRDACKENNGTRFLLDSGMGPWIKRQGLKLNWARRGKETTLTEEQIQLLEELNIDELTRTPWEISLAQLADFQSRHGHTRVPMSHDRRLYRWIQRQRGQYHKRKDGKKSPINPERIEKLESLGFEWTVPVGRPKVDRPPKESRRILWETRLKELIEFQSTHGHTHVLLRDNASLYRWIRQQRLEYRQWKEGKESQMTPERMEKLESLGFEWTVPVGRPKVDRPPKESRRIPWETRLKELIEFQSTHGHTHVLSRDNASVYVWIRQQRFEYRQWKDGKESQMTPERIEKLERVGFEWSVPIGRPKVDRLPRNRDEFPGRLV